MVIVANSLEIEEMACGAALSAHSAALGLRGSLSAADFGSPVCRAVYIGITGLLEQGQVPDVASVAVAMGKTLERHGGVATLGQMYDSVPGGANWQYYAERVKEAALDRELRRFAMNNAEPGAATPFERLNAMQAELSRLGAAAISSSDFDTGCTLANAVADMETDDGRFATPRLSTGFLPLDNAIQGGWETEGLVIIGARPGIGKSSWIATAGIEQLRQGKRIVVYSLEMSARAYALRMVAQLSRVPTQSAHAGMDAGQAAAWEEATRTVYDWGDRLIVKRRSTINAVQLSSLLQADVDAGAECIYIDHGGLVEGEGRSLYERQTHVARACLEAKARCKVPIIVLLQLSRAGERDAAEKRAPRLSDLRDSGRWEENADTVLMLHRPLQGTAAERDSADEAQPMLLKVAKNREGPTPTLECVFDLRLARIMPGMASPHLCEKAGLTG